MVKGEGFVTQKRMDEKTIAIFFFWPVKVTTPNNSTYFKQHSLSGI